MVSRRGFGLPMAVFALMVVAALVATAFFVATEDQRVAENTRAASRALAAAEAGAYQILADLKPGFATQLPVYPRDSMPLPAGRTAAGTGAFTGTLYRMGSALFLLDVIGSSARRYTARVGIIARPDPLEFEPEAALTVQSGGEFDHLVVDGRSRTPPGWQDCDTVSDSGITGLPPILYDSQPREPPAQLMTAQPTTTLPGGRYRTGPVISTDSSCTLEDVLNWGDGIDAASPCASYYPIVHITGTAVLEGGQGQGILLVDGDLEITGPYDYFGVAIVRGSLHARVGARFWGAVFADRVSGVIQVSYSKCSIAKSLHGSAMLAPIRSRHWNQLVETP